MEGACSSSLAPDGFLTGQLAAAAADFFFNKFVILSQMIILCNPRELWKTQIRRLNLILQSFSYFYFMLMGVVPAFMYVCVPHVSLVPSPEARRGHWSPRTGGREGELPCGRWDPNSAPIGAASALNFWLSDPEVVQILITHCLLHRREETCVSSGRSYEAVASGVCSASPCVSNCRAL